jgi:hypothetical protein
MTHGAAKTPPTPRPPQSPNDSQEPPSIFLKCNEAPNGLGGVNEPTVSGISQASDIKYHTPQRKLGS